MDWGSPVASVISTIGNWIGQGYQNRYNSPASQMERFKDAGLNPYLIYSQASSGNMTSQPGVNIAPLPTKHQELMNRMELKQSEADLAIKTQQVNNLKTQNDLNLVKYQDDKARLDAALTPVTEYGLNMPNAYFLNPAQQAFRLFQDRRLADPQLSSLVGQNMLRDYQREYYMPIQLRNAMRSLDLAQERLNFDALKFDLDMDFRKQMYNDGSSLRNFNEQMQALELSRRQYDYDWHMQTPHWMRQWERARRSIPVLDILYGLAGHAGESIIDKFIK